MHPCAADQQQQQANELPVKYKFDPKEEERYLVAQCESLRRYAILGVGMSMIAAFVCILSVPFVYNYLQNVQSLLANEADYCKVGFFHIVRHSYKEMCF